MPEDVVITGMGLASPIGCDEASFWDSLCIGKSGASAVDCLDTSELTRSIACQVREPIELPGRLGRASDLAVTAARQSVASAQLDVQSVDAGRFAIVAGTTMGETQFIEDRLDRPDAEWLTSDHLAEILRGQSGCIAANVQADLNVSGTAFDLYGACAAGNMALASARRSLLAGECDVALAGGADGFSRLAFIGFMRLRVMAEKICRPFDRDRDGLFVGEGAAFFVLERESTAKARGVAPRARIAGAAVSCESYHPTRPHPEGDGLTRATLGALADAGLAPGDIDYVCAHGTGTPQNDMIEVKVMEKCFPDGVSFSSVKALTGHTMGAAAAVEAACCILSLERQTLIPTWHLNNVLEPCNLDALMDAPKATRVRYVVNNSAGFGGYNSSIVLGAA